LEPRFALVKIISGALKYYIIIPAKDQLILKELSYDKEWDLFHKNIHKNITRLFLQKINFFRIKL